MEATGEIDEHLLAQIGRCEGGSPSPHVDHQSLETPEDSQGRRGIFPYRRLSSMGYAAWFHSFKQGWPLTTILSPPGVHLYSTWKCS